MFALLANIASRYKFLIIAFWLVAAIMLLVFAPSLSKVGVTDDTQFLPRDTESTLADQLLREKFPGAIDPTMGSALVVVHNPAGLSQSDMTEAAALNSWLKSEAAPDNISLVLSSFDNDALAAALVSRDRQAMLIEVQLTTSSSSIESREAVKAMRTYIEDQDYGVEIYLTGSAPVSYDALTSIQNTIDKATLVTILLVIVLLLLIYRSPVAICVPLITIGVSYLVARGIAGYIAAYSSSVSSLVDAYLVVTLFGIGTDYCLFMVSRFKEEVAQHGRENAGKQALMRIGPVILASAITVVVTLLCLGISRFGMNRTAGFILAIGVAITLLAGLTLTPALISLFGRFLLWPARLVKNQTKSDGFWSRTGRLITRRPVALILSIVVLLALPFIALPKINYSADLLSQMPKDIGSVEGYNLLKEHFSTGKLNPVIALIESENLSSGSSGPGKVIEDAAESLAGVEGVASVRYYSKPAARFEQYSQESRQIGTNLSLATVTRLTYFQTLKDDLTEIALEYPGILQSPNFQKGIADLTGIAEIASKISPAAPQNIPEQLNAIKPLISDAADKMSAVSQEFTLQVETPFTAWLKSTYFSADGTLSRLDVIMSSDPYSRESIDSVSKIRDALKESLDSGGTGASHYVGGTSAGLADIMTVNGNDFLRVLALSIFGILVVTVILLRSIIAPLYMIITVLFNFGATLGLSTWIFLDLLGQNSMIYMLPIFVFVILVAVGADYNIFLVSRIREESQQVPFKQAVQNAVSNTGGVITSCGIILAGTFATLTTASLQMVFQVGAAIGLGVLIDTFLVRAILIPSIASIVGRWSWWPSGLYRKNAGSSNR